DAARYAVRGDPARAQGEGERRPVQEDRARQVRIRGLGRTRPTRSPPRPPGGASSRWSRPWPRSPTRGDVGDPLASHGAIGRVVANHGAGIHMSAVTTPAAFNDDHLAPSLSRTGSTPENFKKRSQITSVYSGSSSIRYALRPVCSAAISVEPDPPNRSSTFSPARDEYCIARTASSTG